MRHHTLSKHDLRDLAGLILGPCAFVVMVFGILSLPTLLDGHHDMKRTKSVVSIVSVHH